MRAPLLLAALLLAAPAAAQSRKPAPAPVTKQATAAPGLKSGRSLTATVTPRGNAAPVPNRTLEGPREPVPEDRARLNPSIVDRPIPGRGQATEGSVSILEEKLFKPGPGARLSVPFSY